MYVLNSHLELFQHFPLWSLLQTGNMAPNVMVDLLSIEANNEQHDAVLDYYGRRLATCSSDKTIKIFEVEGESHRLVETLKG